MEARIEAGALVARATPKGVLIIDDDALFRRTLARGFMQAGFAAYEADDGKSALVCLRAHPGVSHAVIDLHLGARSGLEVLRDLRMEHPALRCLLFSAFCSTVVAVEAIRLGAINCLPKSTSVHAVIAELASEAPRPSLTQLPVPSLAQIEWDHIQRVLHDCSGNVSQAARKLGLHRQSLQRKLRRYAPNK